MRKSLGLTLMLMSGATLAYGQERGGTWVEFGLTSGLRASDNWNMVATPAENSFQFRNDFSAKLASETRTAKANLEAGFELHHTDIAGSATQTGLADPWARASYAQEGSAASFQLGAYANLNDREIDLSDSTGEQLDTGVNARVAFGQDAPLGGSLSASIDRTNYRDSSDFDFDTETRSLSARLDVAVSRAVTVSPLVSLIHYEVDELGILTTDTTSTGVGITADLDEASAITATVNSKTIDSAIFGETQDVAGSAAYTLTVPDGYHRFSVNRDISNTGTRNELAYQRTVNNGTTRLLYGIGAARASNDSSTWTATLDATQPYSNGALRATLNRSFNTGADGDETLVTDFSAGATFEISDADGLGLDMTYNVEADTGGTSTTEAKLALAYNRAVTEDWDLSAGLEHRFEKEESADAIRGNTIFVTLSRSWISSR